jgi:hypothetical protein
MNSKIKKEDFDKATTSCSYIEDLTTLFNVSYTYLYSALRKFKAIDPENPLYKRDPFFKTKYPKQNINNVNLDVNEYDRRFKRSNRIDEELTNKIVALYNSGLGAYNIAPLINRSITSAHLKIKKLIFLGRVEKHGPVPHEKRNIKHEFKIKKEDFDKAIPIYKTYKELSEYFKVSESTISNTVNRFKEIDSQNPIYSSFRDNLNFRVNNPRTGKPGVNLGKPNKLKGKFMPNHPSSKINPYNVMSLYNKGFGMRSISKITGLSNSAIQRKIYKLQKLGLINRHSFNSTPNPNRIERGTFSPKVKSGCYIRENGICEYCHLPVGDRWNHPESCYHHNPMVCRGGQHIIEHCHLLHKLCHINNFNELHPGFPAHLSEKLASQLKEGLDKYQGVTIL